MVYVSRAQYSDKNIFPFIKEMHSRENMPPFGMVLNGLIASASSSGYGCMDIDTATNIDIAIPISITTVMAMDMAEMKNNEIYYLIILITKKPPQYGGFFMNVIFLRK